MDNPPSLYKVVTIILMMTCWHVAVTAACEVKFDDPKCIYNAVCKEIYTYSFAYYKSEKPGCNNSVIYTGYGRKYYHPVNLKVTNVKGDISVFGTYGSHIITTLDLSNNTMNTYPRLPSMENLQNFSMSWNSLTTAKLSNQYEMRALSEIDYSNNLINTIEMNKDEHPYKNLKKLNIAHNELVEIAGSVFLLVPELEYLDLSYNSIEQVNILTFEGLKKVIYLNISHNRISDINSSLIRFSSIVSLDLSYNKIEHIKLNNFDKLTNLEVLDMRSNSLLSVEENVFNNLVSLHTLDLSNNVLETLHKDTFLNTSNLVSIDLSNNNIKVLPTNMFVGKNITKFLIKGNDLDGPVISGTFNCLSLITDLDLSYQELTSIEDFAFIGLEKMNTILLNNNHIQFVSEKSFKTLTKLYELDLSHNQISYLEFDKVDLINLRSLLLQYNCLTQIKTEYFITLNKLEFLDLSNNNISIIEPNSFSILHNLINFQIFNNPLIGILEQNTFKGVNLIQSLDISNTMLTTISNSSFEGMTHLKDLNMSHGNISELQFNTFSNTGAIESLDLSFNELINFHVNATDLHILNSLDLSNNNLKTLSFNSFNSRLTKINLSHNEIEIVFDKVFVDQVALVHLDLGFNLALKLNGSQIEHFKHLKSLVLSGLQANVTFNNVEHVTLSELEISHSGICNISSLKLKSLKNLEKIALNDNDIVRVEVEDFSNVTKLMNLDLSNNKIIYIQPGVFKDNTKLFMLNISHNLLTTIGYGIFRGLVQLHTLDMSFNQIDNLKTERFYEVGSLSVLIADHNKIDSVSIDEFAGTSLSKLSIGDNPLPCDILVKLKKMTTPFVLTAIRVDDRTDENIAGITCNMNGSRRKTETMPENVFENAKILTEIKDILRNNSMGKTISERKGLEYIANITKQIQQSDRELSSTILVGNNLTNVLLSQILRVFMSLNDSWSSKENVTESINNKKNEHLMLETLAPNHNAIKSNGKTEPQSFIFINVCIGLILFVLVAFVLYVLLYNSVLFLPYRRSFFRERLSSNSLENSAL